MSVRRGGRRRGRDQGFRGGRIVRGLLLVCK
jgi:hypothetical protein